MNSSKYTFESSPYFKSLPSNVQETIKQSGITINSEDDLKKLDELAKLGEPRILLDAQNQNQIGGTGTQIDEELLSLVSKKYKLWIAGGINSENVNHLISNFHPQLIDVSSSLEIEPGIKSEEKIKVFCQQFIDKKTK